MDQENAIKCSAVCSAVCSVQCTSYSAVKRASCIACLKLFNSSTRNTLVIQLIETFYSLFVLELAKESQLELIERRLSNVECQ